MAMQARIIPELRNRRVSARVSIPSNARNSASPKESVQISARTPTAWHGAQFLDDEPANLRNIALHVQGIGAVVTDQRIGHGHDLAPVGRIREHLLITGHRRIEADFARLAFGAHQKRLL